jgi:hypothetical protein
MKTLMISMFALTVLSAGAANASIIGAHVGPVRVAVGGHGHHGHCSSRYHNHGCRR